MEDLRIVLIVAGLIAIGGLLAHGVWTSQKGRSSIKKKIRPITPTQSGRDDEGFDDAGVGKARPANSSDRREPVLADEDDQRLDPLFDEPLEPVRSEPVLTADVEPEPELKAEPVVTRPKPAKPAKTAVAPERPEPVIAAESEPVVVAKPAASKPAQPVAEEPVIKAEPASQPEPVLQAKPAVQPKVKPEPVVKREPAVSKEPVVRREPEMAKEEPKRPEVPPQVFVLYVEAAEGMQFHGDQLLTAALPLGLRFGFMDFFHRHQDVQGESERIYSMANMLKPGTFNMDNISDLRTRGISLFMHLPGPTDPIRAYNQMLQDAQSLAEELGGRVLDAQRNPLNEQGITHEQQRIREHLLQMRLAQAEAEY